MPVQGANGIDVSNKLSGSTFQIPDTAAIFGIKERGTLAPGMFADVNVINLEQLDLGLPEYVHDFPNGAGRYVQRASGYQTTLVNGQVFMQNGEPTGNLAGAMLKNR